MEEDKSNKTVVNITLVPNHTVTVNTVIIMDVSLTSYDKYKDIYVGKTNPILLLFFAFLIYFYFLLDFSTNFFNLLKKNSINQ